MNRDELLDKLAMELAEWPSSEKTMGMPVLPSGYQWLPGRLTGQWLAWPALDESVNSMGVAIGEEAWIQRRAELINKPSWSDAPEWAVWLFQGPSTGDWAWASGSRPDADFNGFAWLVDPFSFEIAATGSQPNGHDWRETLEQRPDEFEPTVEEEEAFNAVSAKQEQPHVTDARRLDAMLAEDMGKDSVGATLDEREKRYGDFSEGAAIMQSLKDEAHGTPGWQRLNYAQREAVDMILHKIGRVLNGDPDYADNWHDIAGYAQLVERTLTAKEREK